jgi:Protein of unknown function (DUF2949)
MIATAQHSLLKFLKDDLMLPKDSIDLALRYVEQDPGPLPIILWQYGLISLDQLSKIYDWQESA